MAEMETLDNEIRREEGFVEEHGDRISPPSRYRREGTVAERSRVDDDAEALHGRRRVVEGFLESAQEGKEVNDDR